MEIDKKQNGFDSISSLREIRKNKNKKKNCILIYYLYCIDDWHEIISFFFRVYVEGLYIIPFVCQPTRNFKSLDVQKHLKLRNFTSYQSSVD